MALYTSAVSTWTPTATADGGTLTASGFHALRSAAATDAVKVNEIMVSGEATSSTVNANAVRRHTTHGTTPTNRVPMSNNPYSVASVFQGFITAPGGQPVVAALATLQHLINLSFNAFGGVIRWVAIPGGELWLITATASNDEMSLCPVTGAGIQSSHFICEEV